MTEELLAVGVILSASTVVLCVVIVFRLGRASRVISAILEQWLLTIEGAMGRSDATIRQEFGRGRDESREGARSLREEITGLFERLAGSLRASLNDLSIGQQAQLETFASRLNDARTGATTDARNLREEIQLTLKQLGESVSTRIGELVIAQGEKLDGVSLQIGALIEGNERRQEALRAVSRRSLGN